MMKNMPKQIIVTIEEPNTENEWMAVHTNSAQAAELGTVKRGGIYVLKEKITVTARTEVTVTPQK